VRPSEGGFEAERLAIEAHEVTGDVPTVAEIDADPLTRLRGFEELADRPALIHRFVRPSGFRFRLRRAVCLSPLRASIPATPLERFTGTGFFCFAHAFTSSARQTGVARSRAIGSGKSSRRAHRPA
jgi:hypothetical protein